MNLYVVKGRIVETLYMDGTILSDNPRKFIVEAESEFLAEKEVNNLCDRMSIDYEMVVTFLVENIVAC